MFGRGRVTGCFAEMFIDVRSNEPVGYGGFDMSDGNGEFPSIARGLTCSTRMYAHHNLLACQTVGPDRPDRREKGEASRRVSLMSYI